MIRYAGRLLRIPGSQSMQVAQRHTPTGDLVDASTAQCRDTIVVNLVAIRSILLTLDLSM
jgi:hypothetical protein